MSLFCKITNSQYRFIGEEPCSTEVWERRAGTPQRVVTCSPANLNVFSVWVFERSSHNSAVLYSCQPARFLYNSSTTSVFIFWKIARKFWMANLNVICGSCGDYFFGSLLSSLWVHFGDSFWFTLAGSMVLRRGNPVVAVTILWYPSQSCGTRHSETAQKVFKNDQMWQVPQDLTFLNFLPYQTKNHK